MIIDRIKSLYNKYILSPEQYAHKIGVTIGKKCNISTKHFGSEPYLITIGDNVRIARGVQFFTHGGIWTIRRMSNKYKNLDYFGKIRINNNVYIGQGALIMPGVTIEDNCIIGAASVVTKSIPKNSVVAGNPIRYISDVNSFINKITKFDTQLYGKSPEYKKEMLVNDNNIRLIEKPFLKMIK